MISLVRRVLTAGMLTGALTMAGLAAAGPAAADTPASWPDAPETETLSVIGLLAGVPLLLFLGIAVAVYLPSMIRGESLAPGGTRLQDEWLGGPRKKAGELAAPDSDDSAAGGASGKW